MKKEASQHYDLRTLQDMITSQSLNIISIADKYLNKNKVIAIYKKSKKIAKNLQKMVPEGITIFKKNIPLLVVVSEQLLDNNQQIELARIDYIENKKIENILKLNSPTINQKIYLILDINPFALQNYWPDKAVNRSRKESKYNLGFPEACALVREKKRIFINSNSITNKINLSGTRFFHGKTPSMEFLPNYKIQLFSTNPWWKDEHFFNPTFTMLIE